MKRPGPPCAIFPVRLPWLPLSERDPETLLTAKNATPIVIGLGEEESFVASDIPALLDYTRRVLFLDDGEMAEVSRQGVTISDFSGRPIEREPRHITWDPITAQKSGYKHFLLKEIHEQPQAIIDTMRSRILEESGEIALGELTDHLPRTRCGQAGDPGCVRYGLARLSGWQISFGGTGRTADPRSITAVNSAIAPRRSTRTAWSWWFLSRGETADTLAALEGRQGQGCQHAGRLQCGRFVHCAQIRHGGLYPCRTRDQRGVN